MGFGATTGNTYTLLSADQQGGLTQNNLILQPSGGRVGIGTTSPGTTLDVHGGLAVSSAQTASISADGNVTPTSSYLIITSTGGSHTATLLTGSLPVGTLLFVVEGGGYPNVASNGVSVPLDGGHGALFVQCATGWICVGGVN